MSARKFRTSNKYKGKRRKLTKEKPIANVEDVLQASTSTASIEQATTSTGIASSSVPVTNPISSATFKKLSQYEQQSYDVDNEASSGNRIVEFSFLQTLISSFCCSFCKGHNLSLREKQRDGLASIISVQCLDCLEEKEFSTSHRISPSESTRGPHEINRLAVTAFREIGCGQAASQSWFAAMNIPTSLSKSTFSSHSQALAAATEETASDVLQEASKIIREMYDVPSSSDIIDISVAYDGTWHRRGHRSHYGIGIVTELVTGLVIDYEVMSTYCFRCQVHQNDDKTSQRYKDWYKDHLPECSKNFSGSANAMESAAALIIWKRSIERYGFRYTTFLGDGDSKTFHDLLQADIYGGIIISKEECVNHVCKRMGTALKNLVAQSKTEGTRISGKGRLTQERILKLQNYYGKAIKDNKNDIEAMRNAVWAVLFHTVSTDKEPHHSRCPKGETSWCWWQRWQATGCSPKRGHLNPLPKDIGEKLVPIFRRLGSDELLKRCLQGKTQNTNECVNSIIWQRCPKVRFAGLTTISYAVAKGISVYNKGALVSLDVAKKMGLSLSVHAVTAAERRDSERKRKSLVQSSEKAKKLRKTRKLQGAKLDDKQQAEEGIKYQPGGF